MGVNWSCVHTTSECPLTLDELVLLESELQKEIISSIGVAHLIKGFAKNVNVAIAVDSSLSIDIQALPNNTVLICKEDLYSVIYKNQNGRVFYKNSNGGQPIPELLSTEAVIVNTCYDGPASHWMALRNAITIPSIANQSELKYVQSKRFGKRRQVRKYSAKLLRKMHTAMVNKINICEVRTVLESSSLTECQALESSNINAFVSVCNNAEKRIKKKVLQKCAIDKRIVKVFLESFNANFQNGVVNVESLLDMLKQKCKHLRLRCAIRGDKVLKQWVNAHKGKLQRDDWREVAAYCVVAMERTQELTVRDNQLQAVALFFMRDEHTFLEVKTGEGKTLIIALVAAIQVLLGRTVDVITSNDILANENATKMNRFYEALGITCACNKANNRQPTIDKPYSRDVVYGNMNQWQFDYLRNCLEVVDEVRGMRQYECCILDEVDLLAVDNCQHIAKISKPFPGMDCLKDLYNLLYKQRKINVSDYPKYLQPYCKYMTDIWAKNRSELDNNYVQNVNYISTLLNGQIIPIDAEATGAFLYNSVFCDGVHQFLEIKHKRAEKSTEILNAIFISNHGFIRMYHGRVFGVTGTLGSEKEQEILTAMFDTTVQFVRIPTYQPSKFEQFDINYILEEEQKHHIQLCKQIDSADKKYEVVILAERYKVPKFLEKVYKIAGMTCSQNFNEAVINCIQNDQFTVTLGQSDYDNNEGIDNLVKTISTLGGIEVMLGESLWRAHLLNKLIEQYGIPLQNKNDYVRQLTTITIRNEYTVINANPLVNELDLNKCKSKRDSRIYIFNHRFDDIAGLKGETLSYEANVLFDHCYFITECSDNVAHIAIHSMRNTHAQEALISCILEVINQNRAVLVICKTVAELDNLHSNLMASHHYEQHGNKVFTYTDQIVEPSNEITYGNEIRSLSEVQVDCGQVILTTNIGGRGADYRTTPELECNGGLHVMLTFLPRNERIERQAFGQTARNGHLGSGQLVLNEIDVMADYNFDRQPETPLLIARRNDLDLLNLEVIKTEKLAVMRFSDEMAQCYIAFYKQRKQAAVNDELLYRLLDVNECWAFWMKLQWYKVKCTSRYTKVNVSKFDDEEHVRDMNAQNKFQLFLDFAHGIIDGETYFNPYYAAKRANYYCELDDFDKAAAILEATFTEEIYSLETQSECFLFANFAIHNDRLLQTALRALHIKVSDNKLMQLQNAYIEEIRTKLMKQEQTDEDENNPIDFIQILINERHETSYNNCIQEFLQSVEELKAFFAKYQRIPSTWTETLLRYVIGLVKLMQGNREHAQAAFKEGYESLQNLSFRDSLKSSLEFLWKLGKNYIYETVVRPITKFIQNSFPFSDYLIEKAAKAIRKQVRPVITEVFGSVFYSQYQSENLKVAVAGFEMHQINEQLRVAVDQIIADKLTTTKTVTVSQFIRIVNEQTHNLHSFGAECKGAAKDFIKEKLQTYLSTCAFYSDVYKTNMANLLNDFLLDIEQLAHHLNAAVEQHGDVNCAGGNLSDLSGILGIIVKDNMLPALANRIAAETNDANRQAEANVDGNADIVMDG